nr:hypothetical protein [Tanacetum cinerariifolium]
MADNQTMAELLQAPTEGYEDAIVILEITANYFELKHGLINLFQNKQFFGHDKEDPHAHIRACPHHGFSELHQLNTFYNALNINDQDSLNSAAGGNILDKMPRERLKIIESKSKVRQSRAKAVVDKVGMSSSTPVISSAVAELKDMVKALLLDKKNQSPTPTPSTTPAPVKAVESNCPSQITIKETPVFDLRSVLKEAIEKFGIMSGFLPNYNKSTIIFGCLSEEEKHDILRHVPFKVETLHVKYLRVPLSSKRIGMGSCKVFIDKIKNRVLNWKNKCLSYAGRLQLIASVLESIHVYRSYVFLLPQTVIDDINKVLKGFLWNQSELAKGKAKNKAMIAQHVWHVAIHKVSLWVKWVNEVKLKGKCIRSVCEEDSDSWGWRNILRIRDEVRQWKDDVVVKDIVVDRVCQWPAEFMVKYPQLAIHDNIVLDDKLDEMVWKSKKGKMTQFSDKQAYDDLRNHKEEVPWNRLVWFFQNIPKRAFVLWMTIQNKLTTEDKIKKRGSFDMMICPLCQQDMDSHQHLFFQCAYVK